MRLESRGDWLWQRTVARNIACDVYRLGAKIISRGNGHSAVAATAYRTGTKIRGERADKTHDYSSRTKGIVQSVILRPDNSPEWMQTAFDISLHTGCRLRETRLPMNCIDFKEDKITFPAPKDGEDRAFSVPMPSALRPLFERLRKTKRKFTVEFPFQPSRRWQQFFIKIENRTFVFTAGALPMSTACAAPVCRVKRPCGWSTIRRN